MDSSNELVLSNFFSVKPKVIFDAWTIPEMMKLWLFKSSDNKIISINIDLTIGGKFSILELNKREEIDHFGKYLQIEKPNKLVFTLEVPWHFRGVSTVSIELRNKHKGCEMNFRQSGIDTNITQESWKKMFENLKTLME